MLRMVLLVLLLGFPAALMIAAQEVRLRQAVMAFFGFLQTPFNILGESLRTILTQIVTQVRLAFAVDGPEGEEGTHGLSRAVWRVIGAILYLVAFAVFAYAEYWLLVLTLAGLLGVDSPEVPASTELLMALAFLGTGFFWGMVLLDILGVTSLAPVDYLPPGHRKWVGIVSLVILLLGLAMAALMGIWRMKQVQPLGQVNGLEAGAVGGIELNPVESAGANVVPNSPNLSPTEEDFGGGGGMVAYVVGGALPVLIGTSAAASGWGVASSLRYLWGIFLGILALPLGTAAVILQVTTGLINMAFTLFDHALAWVGGMGRSFWNWVTRFEFLRRYFRLREIAEPDPHSEIPSHNSPGAPPGTHEVLGHEEGSNWDPLGQEGE